MDAARRAHAASLRAWRVRLCRCFLRHFFVLNNHGSSQEGFGRRVSFPDSPIYEEAPKAGGPSCPIYPIVHFHVGKRVTGGSQNSNQFLLAAFLWRRAVDLSRLQLLNLVSPSEKHETPPPFLWLFFSPTWTWDVFSRPGLSPLR